MIKSLGVFAVSIVLILLIFLVYFLIKRFTCCQKIKTMVGKKMFYSGPIRYVVVGYLKIINYSATLLLIGLTQNMSIIMLVGYSLAILFLMLWPIWSSFFLIKN